MFPFNFEWMWDMSHMVFMGGLHFAMTVITLGMGYCIIKAIVDSVQGKAAITIDRRNPLSTQSADPTIVSGRRFFIL